MPLSIVKIKHHENYKHHPLKTEMEIQRNIARNESLYWKVGRQHTQDMRERASFFNESTRKRRPLKV